MSPARTDDDLERLLRATLSTQARAVDYGPHWSTPDLARQHRHVPRARRWQLAVAAALVLGLIATLVIVRTRHQQRPTPPAGLPASAFTTFDVTGYTITSRETLGDGARSVTVRTPHGERSGDVGVTLWLPHRYRFSPLEHQVAVQVSGHRGFAGTGGTELYRNHDRPLHTVVWEFAPDQWAVAQQIGNIRRVPSPAAILAVARATRPDQHLRLTTPFRLDALPAGYSLDQVIAAPSSQIVFLLLHAGAKRSLEFIAQPPDPRRAPGDPQALVYRRGGVEVTVIAIGPSGRPQPGDRALARQAGLNIIWGTTDLSHIVP